MPVVAAETGSRAYDFSFRNLLAARSARRDERLDRAILRVGAVDDYEGLVDELEAFGVTPMNSPAQHRRASELSHWYDLVASFSPTSRWYDVPPSAEDVEAQFGWPVFVKGDRQTSRHRADRAIARSAADFEEVMNRYRRDPILHWQRVVVRQFLRLRMVDPVAAGGLQASYEFRTFWWKHQLVAAGPYWGTGPRFRWTDTERNKALELAEAVAKAVDVPFVVIDVAQDEEGRWWLIECNDAQESSYAGCEPLAMWQEVLRLCKSDE